MPTRSERRLAELKCENCGQEFAVPLLQLSHRAAEGAEWTPWMVDRIDVRCPKCSSYSVRGREG